MAAAIFISYRHADSRSATERLYEAITRELAADQVYLDDVSTAAGDDWEPALRSAVAGARLVIAVIGPNWLRAADPWGRRLLDIEDDWVRYELEAALASGTAVLPVLVDGAEMPPPEALPPALTGLGRPQAFKLDDDGRTGALLSRLSELVPGLRPADDGEVSIRARFEAIAARFDGAGVDERIRVAEEIAGIGGLLTLDEVLELTASEHRAIRVAATIALGVHLRRTAGASEDNRVRSALRLRLDDRSSLVRYRATEALRYFPALVPVFEPALRRLEAGANQQVARMARRALAGGI
jgi:hypothetical protein